MYAFNLFLFNVVWVAHVVSISRIHVKSYAAMTGIILYMWPISGCRRKNVSRVASSRYPLPYLRNRRIDVSKDAVCVAECFLSGRPNPVVSSCEGVGIVCRQAGSSLPIW